MHFIHLFSILLPVCFNKFSVQCSGEQIGWLKVKGQEHQDWERNVRIVFRAYIRQKWIDLRQTKRRNWQSVKLKGRFTESLVLCRLQYGNGTVVSLPAYLVRRLQSVQNAAVPLVFRLRRSDHITDALVSIHWLRVPKKAKRIIFKIAAQTYRALHGDAPQYVLQFTPIADIPSRQRMRSSSQNDLLVPAVKLPTIGRRAFLVAGARIWNDLPHRSTSLQHRLCSPSEND